MDLLKNASAIADQAELFSTRRKSVHIRFDEGSLSLVAHRDCSACALRVLKGGRLGASYGESASQNELLDDAMAAAAFGQQSNFRFASQQPPHRAHHSHDLLEAETADSLIKLCSGLQDRLYQALPDAGMNLLCESESLQRSVETTEGIHAEETMRRSELRVELPFRDRGTDAGAVGRIVTSGAIDISDEWIARLIEERSWGERPSSPTTGRLPAVLAPSASQLLTFALSSCLGGPAVSRGLSPVVDRLGQQIFSDQITVREDPLIEGMSFSRSFDDEGVACQPRTIIDHGVLRGFITDLRSAAELGQPSTGNAVRRTMFSEKIEDAPTPSFLGAVIEPGATPWRDLVSDIEEGILVTRVLGLHSSNLLQGQFSVQVNGFHIRGGKIAGYLERAMMSGNLFEDFLNIRGISSEREPTTQESMSVAGLAPYIALDSIQLTVGQ